MPDFLSIPGDLRQQYMPFTINGPGEKQLFSFKPKRKSKDSGKAVGIIHPFSKHVQKLFLDDFGDSGIQYTHGPSGKKVEYEEFLDLIPSIQIREYVPDAKLTQTFKWFSYLKRGFDAGLKNFDAVTYDTDSITKKINNLMNTVGNTLEGMTSGDAPLLRKIVGGLAHYYQDKGFNLGSDDGFAVLFLPFVLYYRLTTTHTNNIYELPYSMQNNIFQSDGTYGWTNHQDDFGIMGMINNRIGENPIAKMILGNTIKVNVMPSFQPTGEAPGDTITIHFDLINDSDEAAIFNFLFCHTLFGNNKWLQYGFVQAGSSVYDVKLPGANRYFMCSGKFVCKGKGAFRSPSSTICKGIVNHIHPKNTFAKKLSSNDYSDLKEQMIKSREETIIESISDSTRSIKKSKVREVNSDDQFKRRVENTSDTSIKAVNTSTLSNQKDISPQNPIIASKTEAAADYKESLTEYRSWEAAKKGKEKIVDNDGKIWFLSVEMESLPAGDPKRNEIQEQISYYEHENSLIVEMNPKIADWNRSKEELDQAKAKLTEARLSEINAETALEEAKNRGADEEEIAMLEYEVETARENCKNAERILSNAEAAEAKANIDKNTAKSEKEMKEKRQTLANLANTQAKQEIDAYISNVDVTKDYIAELIKIPDVYSIELTFNSLIPDNFNNYLFGFRAGNLDPIENYFNGNVDEIGAYEKLVSQLEKVIKGEG